jgi:hypothetical protein
MGITKKIKEKVKGTKDKAKDMAADTKDKVTATAKENVSSYSAPSNQDREYEEGVAGTKADRKKDPLKEYDEKEPMSPAKIKEHEPTAVKRDMTEKIVEPGQQAANQEEAKEIARKKGMAKGTAGAAETGSEYEQGAGKTTNE